jgi:hypothetical protein
MPAPHVHMPKWSRSGRDTRDDENQVHIEDWNEATALDYKHLENLLVQLSEKLTEQEGTSRWGNIARDEKDPHFQALADRIRKSFFASQRVWGVTDTRCNISGAHAVNFWSFCNSNLLALLYQDWAAIRGGGKVEDAHRSRLRPLGVDDDAAPSAPDSSETGSMSSTSSPTDQVITSARKGKGKAKNKGQSQEAAQLDALMAQIAVARARTKAKYSG